VDGVVRRSATHVKVESPELCLGSQLGLPLRPGSDAFPHASGVGTSPEHWPDGVVLHSPCYPRPRRASTGGTGDLPHRGRSGRGWRDQVRMRGLWIRERGELSRRGRLGDELLRHRVAGLGARVGREVPPLPGAPRRGLPRRRPRLRGTHPLNSGLPELVNEVIDVVNEHGTELVVQLEVAHRREVDDFLRWLHGGSTLELVRQSPHHLVCGLGSRQHSMRS